MAKEMWTRMNDGDAYHAVLSRWSPYKSLLDQSKKCFAGCRYVLDQGSGPGTFSMALASTGARVLGIDRNPKMIEVARQKQAQAIAQDSNLDGKVIYVAADVQDTPLGDQSVDGVVTNNVVYLVPDPKRMVSESYRVLKPGGRIFITGPVQGMDLSVLDDHIEAEFDEKGILEELRPELEHIQACNRELLKFGYPNPFTAEEMISLLRSVGFQHLIDSSPEYLGQTFRVEMQK